MSGEVLGHAEALERIHDAVIEPDGLRQALAADPALATHLAACPACSAEWEAWLRVADTLGGALAPGVAEAADAGVDRLPDGLRERTLRLVHDAGHPAPTVSPFEEQCSSQPLRLASTLERSRRRLAPVLAAAAVLVVVVGGGGALVNLAHQRDQAAVQRDQAQSEAQRLAGLTGTLDALLLEPGHEVATLASVATGEAVGSVVWGPATGRLAVVTAALAPPPRGAAYRCWVERNGVRHVVGAMQFEPGLAFWAGWLDPSSGIGPGARFGVSLVTGASPGEGPPPAVLLAAF